MLKNIIRTFSAQSKIDFSSNATNQRRKLAKSKGKSPQQERKKRKAMLKAGKFSDTDDFSDEDALFPWERQEEGTDKNEEKRPEEDEDEEGEDEDEKDQSDEEDEDEEEDKRPEEGEDEDEEDQSDEEDEMPHDISKKLD